MRKDHLHRRSKETESAGDETFEDAVADPLSGSADPFDALLKSKPTDSTSTRANGKEAPSPIPDSDEENDNGAKDDDASESVATNGDSAEVEEKEKEKEKEKENEDTKSDQEPDAGYEVEDIVDHKFKGKKKWFKIRWKNYSESDDTWEPEDDLSCPEIIERYLAEHPEANEPPTPRKAKKVRISLPPKEPSRTTPKRTAAERKTITDDPLDTDDEKPKSVGRGRPKKSKSPSKKAEYEVQKIVDDEMRNKVKYYRIRWKGWSAKDDTWEPKSSLACPEIIKAYENGKKDDQEYEIEKIVGEKIEYGKRYFLVKWKGWPESDNTWELENSVDCTELIEKFRDSCQSSSKSNKRAASSKGTKSPKSKKARKNDSDEDDNDDNDGDDGDDDDNAGEWEVEKVVNMRKTRGKKEYLIRWKGCKAAEDTWEPENGISCPELIAAFMKKSKK